jgi:hypothetical protein
MNRRFARTSLAAVLTAAALVSAGCEKHDVVTHAATEGIWVDVGPLDYHIQGSRQLTEDAVPDRSYLKGLPQGILPAEGDETYFAVFLRIENKTDQPAQTAREFEIVDTTGRVFRPLELDPEVNPFAYQPTTLAPQDAIPVPDSAQDFNSFQGAELLFKIPLESYQNRPLEFKIISAGGEPREATLDLDV